MSTHRGIQEVEAESVAMMVAATYGLDTSDYTVGYVAGWSTSIEGKEPSEVIRMTGDRVRNAAIDIIETHEARYSSTGHSQGPTAVPQASTLEREQDLVSAAPPLDGVPPAPHVLQGSAVGR